MGNPLTLRSSRCIHTLAYVAQGLATITVMIMIMIGTIHIIVIIHTIGRTTIIRITGNQTGLLR